MTHRRCVDHMHPLIDDELREFAQESKYVCDLSSAG